jgi:hypothetical protein
VSTTCASEEDNMPDEPDPSLEWRALPDVCLIAGCRSDTDDWRPVLLHDGSTHKACPEHWDAIMQVLGQQTR